MIDAKLKGEGIDTDVAPAPAATNVIDLMAALRRSLGTTEEQKPDAAAAAPTKPTKAKSARKKVS